MARPLALITGASSGIGETYARRLSRDGYSVVLVARRRDLLEKLAQELGNAEVLPADLTSDTGLRAVEERIASAPDLEFVVNNAGFGTMGVFWQTDLEQQLRMHQLHVMTTVRLTHAALRAMVPRGKGTLINVSSVAAFGTAPGSVSYSATKAWMNSFTEGLDMELKTQGSAVKVQALCPGFTITGFHEAAHMDRNTVPDWMWMKAEDVVNASMKGLAKGEVFVVPGTFYKGLVKMQGLMPRGARAAMAMRFARKAYRDVKN
jgi:short-subunit dehydrogenase